MIFDQDCYSTDKLSFEADSSTKRLETFYGMVFFLLRHPVR